MKKFSIVFTALLVGKLILVSCTKDKVPVIIEETFLTAECPDTIFYAQKIKPIIDQSCATANCHNTETLEVDLTTYSQVSANASSILTYIDPTQNPPTQMPLGDVPLADSIIQHFKCWVSQGKLNN